MPLGLDAVIGLLVISLIIIITSYRVYHGSFHCDYYNRERIEGIKAAEWAEWLTKGRQNIFRIYVLELSLTFQDRTLDFRIIPYHP